MSQRKRQWIKIVRQAGGNLEKIMPRNVKGSGTWLTKADIEGKLLTPSPGTGAGRQVTVGMTPEKERKIRAWIK